MKLYICYATCHSESWGQPIRSPSGSDMGQSDQQGFWQQQSFPMFWHYSNTTNGRIIDLSSGDSDSETSWQGGDSDRETFLVAWFFRWTCLGGVMQDSHWQVHYYWFIHRCMSLPLNRCHTFKLGPGTPKLPN